MSCHKCHSNPCCCHHAEVIDCTGITTVTTKPACLSTFFKYAKSKCFSSVDGLLNIFCSLNNIADAINSFAERTAEKGYASGIILFSTPEGDTVDPNDETITQYSKSPFNNKVLGIGVSTIDWNACGGAYVGAASLEVRFWDFTSGAQIGNTLLLTSTSLHDKDTDEGNTIANNIFPGHIYGVKVKYLNANAASCTMPALDFYIIVSPVDVITEG